MPVKSLGIVKQFFVFHSRVVFLIIADVTQQEGVEGGYLQIRGSVSGCDGGDWRRIGMSLVGRMYLRPLRDSAIVRLLLLERLREGAALLKQAGVQKGRQTCSQAGGLDFL